MLSEEINQEWTLDSIATKRIHTVGLRAYFISFYRAALSFPYCSTVQCGAGYKNYLQFINFLYKFSDSGN